jgi:hypothetical protein
VYIPGVLAMVALFMVNTVDARDLNAEHTETAEGAFPGALKLWLCGGMVLGVVSVIMAIGSYVDTWSRHVDIQNGPVSATSLSPSSQEPPPPPCRCPVLLPVSTCSGHSPEAFDICGFRGRGLRPFCSPSLSSSHPRSSLLGGPSAVMTGGARIPSYKGTGRRWARVCGAHLPHNAHTGVRTGIDRDVPRWCVPGCIYHSKGLQTLAARHLSSESAPQFLVRGDSLRTGCGCLARPKVLLLLRAGGLGMHVI